MSLAKARVDADTLLAFLRSRIDRNITHLQRIEGGESSQAFFFPAQGRELVVRVHTGKEGETEADHFQKDRFAALHLSGHGVPVPEVVDIGTLGGLNFYIITVKCSGRTLDKLSPDEMRTVLPEFLRVLDAIHGVDVSRFPGYGIFDHRGAGPFGTWRDFILSIGSEREFSWTRLFENTFFEREVFERLHGPLTELAEFLPEERKLVHGDYGFGNVLSEGGRITGVLDWESALFGDSLYELAHLIVQEGRTDYGRLFYQHRQSRDGDVDRYEERVLCYVRHDALAALHFYAVSDQRSKYERLKNMIFALLGKPGFR
jgi:hygromycin-B 4-O-kinase